MIWGDDNLKMEVVINKCHLFFFRSKPVGPEQILLRGANLRNTQWVFGEFWTIELYLITVKLSKKKAQS